MSQQYTACERCDWFGIPILDGGAPEECDNCLREILGDAAASRDTETYDDAAQDLWYYIKRQEVLPVEERRFNDGAYISGAHR